MTDLVAIDQSGTLTVHRSPNFMDLEPAEMVKAAAKLAGILADIIVKQQLFTVIQGKKYVRVEAWATLGSLMGIMPREVDVKEKENGDYEATVELYSIRTDQVVGRGSALCGADERRWGAADRYARRSMAITRATGKAYRLGFAWIMSLAGYEPTPAEEMPDHEEKPKQKKNHGYEPTNPDHQKALGKALENYQVKDDRAKEKISTLMVGRTFQDLPDIIAEVLQ
jgi:hypothetical protein